MITESTPDDPVDPLAVAADDALLDHLPELTPSDELLETLLDWRAAAQALPPWDIDEVLVLDNSVVVRLSVTLT